MAQPRRLVPLHFIALNRVSFFIRYILYIREIIYIYYSVWLVPFSSDDDRSYCFVRAAPFSSGFTLFSCFAADGGHLTSRELPISPRGATRSCQLWLFVIRIQPNFEQNKCFVQCFNLFHADIGRSDGIIWLHFVLSHWPGTDCNHFVTICNRFVSYLISFAIFRSKSSSIYRPKYHN